MRDFLLKMASKPVKAIVKVNIKGGEATPAPPLGTALGPHGIQIMEFVKAYNDQTADKRGQVVPAVITIYEDRSFDFILKLAPVSEMIKKELGLKKGSGEAPRKIVGTLTKEQVKKIAEEKMADLNANDVDAAIKIVEGSARSMGVEIKK